MGIGWRYPIVLFVVLFVMIFIGLGLLVPWFGRITPEAARVRQRAQLHTIDAALDLFVDAFNSYPPSDANDGSGAPYCGAMKLCEAMLGQDMLGFHQDSVFAAGGSDAAGNRLYGLEATDPDYEDNLRARKGPYLPIDNFDVLRMRDVYGDRVGPFSGDERVLCGVYRRVRSDNARCGMPILYYRAEANGTANDIDNPDNPQNIYDYRDNQALLELVAPGEPDKKHPLADPRVFYEFIRDTRVEDASRPVNPGTYILIAAGPDGLYGTEDDITNFER